MDSKSDIPPPVVVAEYVLSRQEQQEIMAKLPLTRLQQLALAKELGWKVRSRRKFSKVHKTAA